LKVITKQLIISGKVQGVFYRASAKKIADQMGVQGWIKNLANGNVEAVISGSEEQINQFIKWAWEGPPKSRVDHIDIHLVSDSIDTLPGFSILR